MWGPVVADRDDAPLLLAARRSMSDACCLRRAGREWADSPPLFWAIEAQPTHVRLGALVSLVLKAPPNDME